MPVSRFLVFALLLSSTYAAPAFAESDKEHYTLFRPTPDEKMRELSTDRPDKTESPYTVDAGHFQIETDLVTYTRNHDKIAGGDESSRGFSVGVTNFKAGLTNDTDLQFVVESYLYNRTTDRIAGSSADSSGFGDITVRLKHNIWGNGQRRHGAWHHAVHQASHQYRQSWQ